VVGWSGYFANSVCPFAVDFAVMEAFDDRARGFSLVDFEVSFGLFAARS
jgi:hypothetical protein